jgi:hypothetical protein
MADAMSMILHLTEEFAKSKSLAMRVLSAQKHKRASIPGNTPKKPLLKKAKKR